MDLTPMKKDNSASNEIKLSDQQVGEYKFAKQSLKRKTVYKKVTPSINHQSRVSISARAMGRIEKYISKPKAIIFKKIRRFINSTVKTLQLLNTIILQHSNNCPCPVILVKMLSMLNAAKQKLLFYGLSAK
jgi:Cu(I)/Ag(I) efflux system membrane fusion protein